MADKAFVREAATPERPHRSPTSVRCGAGKISRPQPQRLGVQQEHNLRPDVMPPDLSGTRHQTTAVRVAECDNGWLHPPGHIARQEAHELTVHISSHSIGVVRVTRVRYKDSHQRRTRRPAFFHRVDSVLVERLSRHLNFNASGQPDTLS